jgi:hypothetical protein
MTLPTPAGLAPICPNGQDHHQREYQPSADEVNEVAHIHSSNEQPDRRDRRKDAMGMMALGIKAR